MSDTTFEISDETLSIADNISISEILRLDPQCADALIRALCFVRKHTIVNVDFAIDDENLELVKSINRFTGSLGTDRRNAAFQSSKHAKAAAASQVDQKRLVNERLDEHKVVPDWKPSDFPSVESGVHHRVQLNSKIVEEMALKIIKANFTTLADNKPITFNSAVFDRAFYYAWCSSQGKFMNPDDMVIGANGMPRWKTLTAQVRMKLRAEHKIGYNKQTKQYTVL